MLLNPAQIKKQAPEKIRRTRTSPVTQEELDRVRKKLEEQFKDSHTFLGILASVQIKLQDNGISVYVPSREFWKANLKQLRVIINTLREDLQLPDNYSVAMTINPQSPVKRPVKKTLTREETWEKMKKENPWLGKLTDELGFETS